MKAPAPTYGLAAVPVALFPGSAHLPLSSCGSCNDFIFLPLTLGCSVAYFSIYLLPLGKETLEIHLGQTAHLWDPDDLEVTCV